MDLQTKEDCERDRAVDAREAAKFSREIDDATDLATSLKTQIREIEGQIKASEEEQLQIRDQDAKATKIRGEENKAWEATDATACDVGGELHGQNCGSKRHHCDPRYDP